jgi:hypothetical protein
MLGDRGLRLSEHLYIYFLKIDLSCMPRHCMCQNHLGSRVIRLKVSYIKQLMIGAPRTPSL